MNPLEKLFEYGQSFWYDNLRRQFLHDGTLQNFIDNDGLRGMTSNPAIFKKAIADSDDYDEQLAELAKGDGNTNDIYEALAIQDIQDACDLFAGIYQSSDGVDGYVSLEVSPDLARDTEGTIAEGRRLFQAVGRPNLMIKVPATPEGIPAIAQLLSEGVNINITLMFSMAHYDAVAQAYLAGIRKLIANGGDASKIASVASFFVSRVDSMVDKILDKAGSPEADALKGKVAVANSKVVYQRYKEIFHGDEFADLREANVSVQRLLWASTSTKNPDYPDTLYVDSLIGPETVNTMPPETLESFRDHGTLANSLEENVAESEAVLQQFADLGFDLNKVGDALQDEGVDKFSTPFAELMAAIEAKVAEMRGE